MPCDCTDDRGVRRPRPPAAEEGGVGHEQSAPHPRDRAGDRARRAARSRPDPRAATPQAIPDLAEQNFGDWQGMTYEELRHVARRRVPPLLARPGASARAGRRELRRADGAGRPRDPRAHRSASRPRHHRRRAWRHDPRRARAWRSASTPRHCLAFTMENCSLTRIDHIEGPGMGHDWRVITVNRPPK